MSRRAEGQRRSGRKNTKLWCRGRVGVPHREQVIKEQWGNIVLPCRSDNCWHRVICEVCGKHLGESPDCPELKERYES